MKKLQLAVTLGILLAACNSKPDGYTLEASLSGDIEDGTKVFLRKIGEFNQPVDVDSTTITKGEFVFKGVAGPPEMHYIFLDKVGGYATVILENGKIELVAQKDSLGLAKVTGTLQNKIFLDYMDQSQEISKRAMSINNDLQIANASRDTVAMKSLRDEFVELQEEYKNFEINYIKNNPNGLISALLLDRALSSKALPENEINEMYEALTPEIKETTAGKLIQEKLSKNKSTSIGNKAPGFSGPTPTGDILALNEATGKVTIIDFWAAWCRPCRAENPNVVNVYKKYHEKGLNIIGVSLDRNKEDWHKAIADDGLTWHHISNLAYFDDQIAKLYNVEAIPATFILDEDGVIIAKDLRGAALEEKIAELLQ